MGYSASADIHFGYAITDSYGEGGSPWIGYEDLDNDEGESRFYGIEDWLNYLAEDTTEELWSKIPDFRYKDGEYVGPMGSNEYRAAEAKWNTDNPWWEEEYQAARKRAKERIENCPLDISYVGYMDGYSIPVIHFKEAHQGIYEYGPEPLKPLVVPSVETIESARIFCEKNRIVWKEPQWLLSASYG